MDIFSEYQQVRSRIYSDVLNTVVKSNPEFEGLLSLEPITNLALYARDSWEPNPDKNQRIASGGEEWRHKLAQYRKNYPRRIELAIWHDLTLCGLMLGKASKGRLVVKINFIESSYSNPLKGLILPIALRCAENFAAYVGADWVAVQDPIEGVIPLYNKFGFTINDPFDPRNNALYKRLGDDNSRKLLKNCQYVIPNEKV